MPRAPAPGSTGSSVTSRATAAEVAQASDLEANTGDLVDLARHVADVLAAFGERLRAGEIIICGSVVPPLFTEPHDRVGRVRAAAARRA